jgi:hypothetical protein
MSMGEPANDERFLKSRVPFQQVETFVLQEPDCSVLAGSEFKMSDEGMPYSIEPSMCSKCDGWFYTRNISCCVDHGGACCHEHDRRATPWEVDEFLAEKEDDCGNEDHNIEYKFSEDDLIAELRSYVASTYQQHYAQSKIQSTEVIIDQGHGIGFCAGNALKYLQRYGKKDGYNRKDILKALHYILILLYVHDLEHAE